MVKIQGSFRLSDATRAKLRALSKLYGTQTETLAVAIDRLYRAEFGDAPPDPHQEDKNDDRGA